VPRSPSPIPPVRKRCRCKRKIWPKCPHGWHLNFTPRGGQDFRLSLDVEVGRHIDSKTEADAEATQIKGEILAGTFIAARDRCEAVEATAAGVAAARATAVTAESYTRCDWLPSVELNLKASTVYFYRDNLENHVFPLLGSLPIGEITRKDCRQLITTTRGKGVAITTVRGVVRTLSHGAVTGRRRPAAVSQSCPGMRKCLRRGDAAEAKKDPFTQDEVTHLVDIACECYPEWHPCVLCGLRDGAAAW
jgi:hypothetical protein